MSNRVWWFALPLMLAGCASPGDVEASYSRELGIAQEELAHAQQGVDAARRNYESDLASAREWDVHVLGIPASGWVTLSIVGAVLLAVLLGWGIYLLRSALQERRALLNNREQRAHQLAMAREKTRQAEFDSVMRYVPPPLSTEVKS